MNKIEIYIGAERLDLFDDETITVNRSVQNIDDIARNFNDYSEDFTVPASPRNNAIFKHFYNFSISNGFDARVRHNAFVNVDHQLFTVGSISLVSSLVENHQPANYKIRFIGRLISLKELIGDDYLNVLDLTEYDVEYSSDNVLIGLETGFFSEDVIFPLISTEKQWFYNSDSASDTNEEKLVNIAFNGSVGSHGFSWTSLRPSLKVIRIIEKIQETYGITFSEDFFNNVAPIGKLYLWLNNEDVAEALQTTTRVVDYDEFEVSTPSVVSFNNSTGTYTPVVGQEYKIEKFLIHAESSDTVPYTVQILKGTEVIAEESSNEDVHLLATFDGLEAGDTMHARIITTSEKTFEMFGTEISTSSWLGAASAVKNDFTISGSTMRINSFMPNLKILDFLKGLINMHNCVIVPTGYDSFEIKTLDNWYLAGNVYDVSAFIDYSSVPVSRGTLYKEIQFKFESAQTILAEQFEKFNNVGYGDLETTLKNQDGTSFDGDEYTIDIPFEQMVYEKLNDLDDNTATSLVYGLSLSGDLDEETPVAHIHYAIHRDISTYPISMINDNDAEVELDGSVFMPSHVDSDSVLYSTTFGGDINEHNRSAIQNSLYKVFYKDYILDSFSKRRRKINYKGRFPAWLLAILKLNDKLIIGDDRFLINDIKINLNTGAVDLTLLNDIYNTDVDLIDEEVTPPDPVPPPTPPSPAWSLYINLTPDISYLNVCGRTISGTKYWDGGAGDFSYPQIGDKIYNDLELEDPFVGDNYWYAIGGGLALQIYTNGEVTAIYNCATGLML